MNIFSIFFQQVVVRPIFNGLIFFYTLFPYHDFGLSVILLVVCIRLVLAPLNKAQLKTQEEQMRLQPKIAEIRRKFKDKKEAQQKALMELYQQEGVNPLSVFVSFFGIVIQIFLFVGLYRVFSQGLHSEQFSLLYSFLSKPEHLSTSFLGMVDLAKGNLVISLIAGISQFFQARLLLRSAPPPTKGDTSFAAVFQKQSVYMLPIVTVLISLKFPSALPLSWTVMNIFAILQQELLRRKKAAYAGNKGKNQSAFEGISGSHGV